MTDVPRLTLGDLDLGGVDPVTGAEFTTATFTGWDGSASTAQAQQKPRSHGAWVGGRYAQAKHPVVTGLILAPSAPALEDARDRLVVAASIEDTTLMVHGAARDRWGTVCREDEPLIRTLTPTSARYSIQLIAADPRKFGSDLTASTALPSSTGGLTAPFTAPFTVDAVQVSGQVHLANPGNATGPVRLRIDGPVTGPIVTHVGSGPASVLALSLVLGAGEYATVDMERHEVLAMGQSGRGGWVTQRGWSGFEPGWNTWSFSAVGYDAAASLTVTAIPAWE